MINNNIALILPPLTHSCDSTNSSIGEVASLQSATVSASFFAEHEAGKNAHAYPSALQSLTPAGTVTGESQLWLSQL